MNGHQNEQHRWISEILPEYVNGSLDLEQSRQLESHLIECRDCQDDLAFWRQVSAEIQDQDRTLLSPADLAARILSNSSGRLSQSTPLVGGSLNFNQRLYRAWLLLQSQAPLVRREIWPASAAVLFIGFAVTVLSGQWRFLSVLAPLVAAGAIAALYGTENDPAVELTLSTPTSPRQILIARVVLVFGYNLVLTILTNLALMPFNPSLIPGSLILEWLGPMVFLSGAALLLSLWVRTSSAVAITYLAWIGQFLVQNILHDPGSLSIPTPAILNMLAGYLGFWTNHALLLPLGLLLFVMAIWQVGRSEVQLTMNL